jgi:hypothetical protein
LAKTTDRLELIDVEQTLIPYNGNLRTRTEIYKEQLGK